MADSTISGLPPASTLTGAEVFPIVQSGANAKETITAVSEFANTNAGTYYPTIVQRVTNFQNIAVMYTERDGGYYFYGNTNFPQSVANTITGYAKAQGAVRVFTPSTAVNATSNVRRNGGGSFGSEFGQVWETGSQFQLIAYATPTGFLPSAGDDIEYRIGYFYDGYYLGDYVDAHASYATDPFANIDASSAGRAAAYFYADKASGFWKCKSGTGGVNTPETTTTTVAVSVTDMKSFRIKIGTTGAVQFWIDDVLVATHNSGVIATGKQLSEAVNVMNVGAVSTAEAHGWVIASIGHRAVLESKRTGFYFV